MDAYEDTHMKIHIKEERKIEKGNNCTETNGKSTFWDGEVHFGRHSASRCAVRGGGREAGPLRPRQPRLAVLDRPAAGSSGFGRRRSPLGGVGAGRVEGRTPTQRVALVEQACAARKKQNWWCARVDR